MKTIAVCNMKGGVGKTTTAVSLSYLAATAGRQTLLWDLDPQAASSFAFRVRPRVPGFGRKHLQDGESLEGAIKETDYDNLHVLPADFAYRRFDRLLDSLGKPDRVLSSVLATIGREFDVVFLDCPAGFSRLTEGIVAAADAILVPTIPTVLSLRTLVQLIKWADRSASKSTLAPFLNLVDRRKDLHRRASEWCAEHPDVFLSAQIPYASMVEQIAVRRTPLPIFAAREPAAMAFAQLWSQLETWFQQNTDAATHRPRRWADVMQAVQALSERLDTPQSQQPDAGHTANGNNCIVHRFDTETRDLERCGYALELRERTGHLLLVARRLEADDGSLTSGALARIDSGWAVRILAGEMSPLAALEKRLSQPILVERIRTAIGKRPLLRTKSLFSSRSTLGSSTSSDQASPLTSSPS